MSGTKTVLKKELDRVFHDKKLIFSLFILPAVLMVGIFFLMGQLMTAMMTDIETHESIVYMQNVPSEVEGLINSTGYAATASITFLDADDKTDDIQSEINNGNTDLLVVFPTDFMEIYASYEEEGDAIPAVDIYYSTSGNYSSEALDNFETYVLDGLTDQLLLERLGNMEQLQVFTTNYNTIVDEEKASGEILAMILPYLITFMLFVGAMSLGVDAFAGEKERGTMTMMLLTPRSRWEIAFGKLIALAILSGISAVIYAISMLVGLPTTMGSMMGSAGAEMSLSVSFSALQVIQLLIIMISMVFLYVSIVALVAIVSKNSKEAQTYVSPIYIVVMLAGLLTLYQGGIEKALSTFAVPVYGAAIAIQNIMTNELTMTQFALAAGSNILFTIILIWGITKAFDNEKTMFNA